MKIWVTGALIILSSSGYLGRTRTLQGHIRQVHQRYLGKKRTQQEESGQAYQRYLGRTRTQQEQIGQGCPQLNNDTNIGSTETGQSQLRLNSNTNINCTETVQDRKYTCTRRMYIRRHRNSMGQPVLPDSWGESDTKYVDAIHCILADSKTMEITQCQVEFLETSTRYYYFCLLYTSPSPRDS